MVRCAIKDQAYYQQFLGSLEALIERSYANVTNGEVRPERMTSYLRNLMQNNLHLAIGYYSSGAEIESMRKPLERALALMDACWRGNEDVPVSDCLLDEYVDMIWIVTLSMFLKVDQESHAMILRVVHRNGMRDWLMAFLLSREGEKPSGNATLLFPSTFRLLKAAAEESDTTNASQLVKQYLEKEWYRGHRQAYWYNTHQNIHDVFFGYWSFEAAAVVKIAGIDDRSFRDCEYYPKDLV